MSACTIKQTVSQDIEVDGLQCDRCAARTVDTRRFRAEVLDAVSRGFKLPEGQGGDWLRIYRASPGAPENDTRLDYCAGCTPHILAAAQRACPPLEEPLEVLDLREGIAGDETCFDVAARIGGEVRDCLISGCDKPQGHKSPCGPMLDATGDDQAVS